MNSREMLERERDGSLERNLRYISLKLMKGPTLSLGRRGVFILTKKTPTPGLWIRHTVGKDPSFLHDVT
jgi:hypothetical protein